MGDDDRNGASHRATSASREALPGRARTVRLLAVTAVCIVASAAVLVAVLVVA